jgi:hypothetical protein
MDVRFGYYSWIYDRGWHGLRNMIKQFMGYYPTNWGDVIGDKRIPLTEFHKYVIQNYDGINTYLFKNFEKYDIIAFVTGYNTRFLVLIFKIIIGYIHLKLLEYLLFLIHLGTSIILMHQQDMPCHRIPVFLVYQKTY